MITNTRVDKSSEGRCLRSRAQGIGWAVRTAGGILAWPDRTAAACDGGRAFRSLLVGASQLDLMLLLSLGDKTLDPGEITSLFGRHVPGEFVVNAFGHVQGNCQWHRR